MAARYYQMCFPCPRCEEPVPAQKVWFSAAGGIELQGFCKNCEAEASNETTFDKIVKSCAQLEAEGVISKYSILSELEASETVH